MNRLVRFVVRLGGRVLAGLGAVVALWGAWVLVSHPAYRARRQGELSERERSEALFREVSQWRAPEDRRRRSARR